MYEIIDYSSINPLITGCSFLVLGFLGGIISGITGVVKKVTGIFSGTPSATTANNKSSADAAALLKKKLQLAKAKAKTKIAKAKAKMLQTILMVGGGIVLLVIVFSMAKGRK